jgi:hypothetical protein
MASAFLVCGVLLTLVGLLCCCSQHRNLAARLERIERLKKLTERLDAHGVRSSRVKLV